jgi:hypothetical protein
MAIITSSSQSKFLNNQEHKIHTIQNEQSKKNQEDPSLSTSLEDSGFDVLDLTPATKNLLQQIEEKFYQTLSSFPEYQTHFDSEGIVNTRLTQEKQGIHYLRTSKLFLNNPYIIRLSEQDSRFESFYNKIESLMNTHDNALQKHHQQKLTQESPTYHHIIRH